MAVAQNKQATGRPVRSAPAPHAQTSGVNPVRRRWPRRVLLVFSALMLIFLGIFGYFFTAYQLRTHPGAKSVASALHSFRGSGPMTRVRGSSYAFPQAGVYTMRGKGLERISFPPDSQHDGALVPVTISYLSSACWRMRLDFNAAHWEDYVFCPSALGLRQPGTHVYQAWDFGVTSITNLSTVTCPAKTVVLPREPKEDALLTWTCLERNTNTAIGSGVSSTRARVIGFKTLRVGDVSVPTVEERQTATVSGAQTGSVVTDWWFATSSGLPVRLERHRVVHSPSPIGTVTYTEDGSGVLTSLEPRT
jgi:hypothetical protein